MMPDSDSSGRLAFNVLQFCRGLRAAGMPVGIGAMMNAVEAVRAIGIERRDDVQAALRAVLVYRQDQYELFDQAFDLFWRVPDLASRDSSQAPKADDDSPESIGRRVAQAFAPLLAGPAAERPVATERGAARASSAEDLLYRVDFEQMSADEIARARRAIAALRLPMRDLPTRRFAADPAGRRIDLRRTLRLSLRSGAATIALARKTRRTRPPPLVVLCDISGSMSLYSRLLLHFVHAVAAGRDRVHAFAFGTRLTNITRQIGHPDVDRALDRAAAAVRDWSGGTRIGRCLHDFNRLWSRRVLGHGAVVLLITDGLERDDPALLAAATDRLHRSCRRLIWLNPLLRHPGYAPKSQGARVMIGHVDELRPAHSLASLDDLVRALSGSAGPRHQEFGGAEPDERRRRHS